MKNIFWYCKQESHS